jgi:preprotein translocase subunit YajC
MEVAIVYFALLALAFFFLIVRPQRRRVTAHRAFVSALELGDDIVTTGGIYGTVRALRGDAVELEIAPGIVITVARAAIAQRAYADAPDAPDAIDATPELDGPADGNGNGNGNGTPEDGAR